MLRSLWIAKTGMDAQQFNLDVITNNLANSSTTAFKRVQPMFQDLLYTTLRSAGSASNAQNLLPTGLQIGAGSAVTSTERNNIQGGLIQTGNQLDLAIQGNGFFQIQLADGTLAYTRNGQFSKSATGQIVTQAGNVLPVLGLFRRLQHRSPSIRPVWCNTHCKAIPIRFRRVKLRWLISSTQLVCKPWVAETLYPLLLLVQRKITLPAQMAWAQQISTT